MIEIGKVCDVLDGPHATPKKIDSGPVYLGIDAITNNGQIKESEYAYLSEEDYIKWTKRVEPRYGDLVFSYEATLGRYALIPEGFRGALGRRLAVVRPKSDDINIKWLLYYFLSPSWSAFIRNNTVKGSTVDRISVEDFPGYKIPMLSREEQDRIVNVLEPIDRKIRQNKKINDNLEQQLQALFNYWFIQFNFPQDNGKPYAESGGRLVWNETIKREIPEGWTVKTIGELLEPVPNTARILSSEYLEIGDFPVIDQSSDFIAGFTNEKDSCLRSDSGYIVFGDHTRVVKYISFPFARGADGTQVLSSNSDAMPNELFYRFVKGVDLSNYGYARHFKFLKDSLIIVPKEDVAKMYVGVVKPLLDNQRQLVFENLNLARLRDWLIPMLMNGQATITD